MLDYNPLRSWLVCQFLKFEGVSILKLGIGKLHIGGGGSGGTPAFEPTEADRAFLEPHFANPLAVYVDVKKLMAERDGMTPEYVDKLADWYGHERLERKASAAGSPEGGTERIRF